MCIRDRIDTQPLAELVEALKETENQYYEQLLKGQGVEASETNVNLFRETTERVNDLKTVPAYVLGAQGVKDASVAEVHDTGRATVSYTHLDVYKRQVLTYAAQQISGYPVERVFGSGTVLDTARLKYQVGRHLDVDSRSVHAVIIGEHGDSELPVWSGANVSGIDLNHFCELRGHFNHEASMERLYEEVRDSAYEIIERKGATYYGIALSLIHI